MAEKACKKCRAIVTGDACPLCQGTDLTRSWEGQIVLFNAETSLVAEAIGAKAPGKYALKIK
jgi:DNA-directed RNA polymerase subunit E"